MGDINGDGLNDVVIAAPGTELESGLAVLYHRKQEADISVAPSPVVFGDIPVGTTSSQTIMISNEGLGVDLEIGTINLSGTNVSEFIIQNDNCSEQKLPPSETCAIDVTFVPISKDSKTAFLNVPSNDSDSPILNISLNGEGHTNDIRNNTKTNGIATLPYVINGMRLNLLI